MAGNGLIKLLRCTSTTRASSTAILLDGQPMVEKDTNLIYVGDGVTEARNLTPYGGGGGTSVNNHERKIVLTEVRDLNTYIPLQRCNRWQQ